MIVLIVVLSICFVLSAMFNVFLILKVIQFADDSDTVGEKMNDVFGLISEYEEHLKGVYDLPSFYGDEEIKLLVQHTTFLREELQKVNHVFSEESEDQEEETTETEELLLHQSPPGRNSQVRQLK